MLKRKLSVFLIITLILSVVLPVFIASVSSSSGAILINSKTISTPGQQIEAGDTVNLYFGSVTWNSVQTFLMLTTDNSPSASSGYVYTPCISVFDIIDTTAIHTYSDDSNFWIVGDYWVNGTIPKSLAPGNYYIKAIDDISSRTAVTDIPLTIKAIAYDTILNISPSEGTGGIPLTFSGSGYPAGERVSIQYYDSFFNQWRLMTETIVDVNGQISVDSVAPDLKKSVSNYDSIETCTQIQYRAQGSGVSGTIYGYATYNQYARGLKIIGDQTAYGLFGNGTNLHTVKTMAGDTLVLSGKWFHSNDQIYIRWDSDAIVGTVTSDEWANAIIIGSSIANVNGSFSTTITIPETAYAGEHYIAIEDSEARVTIKISVSKAYLQVSPSAGPGGANVEFTGTLYPPNTNISIYYLDPDFGSWNYWTNTRSDSNGIISFNTKIPDLKRSGYGESNSSSPISFRTEVNGVLYSYVDYTQFWRGLKQIGNAIAVYGVFGDGTNLASRVTVQPGESIIISGCWFHANDIVSIEFGNNPILSTSYLYSTRTSDEWLNTRPIATTTTNDKGAFETTIIMPETRDGIHYIAFEDSQIRMVVAINVRSPNPTPTPTTQPTANPTVQPTVNPTFTPTPQPPIHPPMPTPSIDLAAISTIAGTNFRVNINGVVSLNNSALANTPVFISYSITGGRTWESLTLAQTASDGAFAVVWTPAVTGDYQIKAEVEATKTTDMGEKTVTVALTPDNSKNSESNMFTVNSNSTIREFKFDPDNKRLSFTVEGPTGTTGYVDVYIPKVTLSSISTLRAYLDDNEIVDFSSASRGDSWQISFAYTHSIHKIAMNLDSPTSNNQADNDTNWTTYAIAIVVIVVIATAIIGTIMFTRKHKR